MSTQVFLTTTGGATWTVPSDFNPVNTVEVVGSGGGGGTASGATGSGGGGGGGYSKTSNVSLAAGASISYTVDAGGAGAAGGGNTSGQPGGDTFFNGASYGAAIIGAHGGAGGTTGGAGGAGGIGVTFTGGAGAANATTDSGGGGGAAGPNGAGASASGKTGGTADNTHGGAGGSPNGNGGAGTEFDGSHGCGGGAGGAASGSNCGTAGLYGGGGAGAASGRTSTAGAQGLIVITYTSLFTSPRYWVGGTGNWDASTTTHWSTTSGGGGGASVPTTSNDVIFDFNSGGGTVTLTATGNCRTINIGSTFGYAGTLNLGSQTLNLGGSGSVWNVSPGFTFVPGTSTIKLSDATSAAKTFTGLNLTYNNLYITGSGTGTYTITGSNTFNDFKADTPPHTVNFTAGTTQTITTFTVNGTAGNLMTLQSTVSGVAWFLHGVGTTISCDYLSLQDSHAF